MRKRFGSRPVAADHVRLHFDGLQAMRGPLALSLALTLAGCSTSAPSFSGSSSAFDPQWGVSASKRVVVTGPIPKGGGHYKLGKPYQVGGRWYVPRHEPYYDRVGVGSWYGMDFHGRKTANGEIFDMDALTAAHPTLPMPSYAYVTNMRNGRTILVRINDRGPYVANREIDLSRASARAIGYAGAGLSQVRVRWAGHAPLDGNDSREQAFLRNQPWNGGGGYRVSEGGHAPQPTRDVDYDRPSQRRYAQDLRQQNDAYDVGEPMQDERHQPARLDRMPVRVEREPLNDAYQPPHDDRSRDSFDAPRQAVRQASRPRYAEYETRPATTYVEPPEQMAPATENMWSPFSHREELQSAKRK